MGSEMCIRDSAGSGTKSGARAAHDQAAAVYALLDELRLRHPGVEWESCAAGAPDLVPLPASMMSRLQSHLT